MTNIDTNNKTSGQEPEIISYSVATPFLAAIIDGDMTGLEEEDYLDLQLFLKEEETANGQGHWTCDVNQAEGNFTVCEITGLHADCQQIDYVIM